MDTQSNGLSSIAEGVAGLFAAAVPAVSAG